jgi:hypothetical protein
VFRVLDQFEQQARRLVGRHSQNGGRRLARAQEEKAGDRKDRSHGPEGKDKPLCHVIGGGLEHLARAMHREGCEDHQNPGHAADQRGSVAALDGGKPADELREHHQRDNDDESEGRRYGEQL